jgi:O-succinylbenzoic acid--CoA ligase
MDPNAKRGVAHVTAKWQLPQIIDALSLAVEDRGPAIRFGQNPNPRLESVPEDIAVIVQTSGSTGSAKEVGISSKALISSATAANNYLGAKTGDYWSLLLPLTHIAGVNVLVRSMQLGREPIDLRNHQNQPLPRANFTAIVPTQLHRAISGDDYLLEHLKSADRVLVGSASVSDQLRQEALTQGIHITETYGMTESCGGCIYDGNALPTTEVAIIEGRIALRGASIATSYISHTLENSKFESITNDQGWFITSDLGEINGSQVKINSRIDDLIKSGGEKISLQQVESFYQARFPNCEVAAFATADNEWGQQLSLAITEEIDESELELAALELVRVIGAHAKPKHILRVKQLPKSTLGKIDRGALSAEVEKRR